MPTKKELIEIVRSYEPNLDEELLSFACDFSKDAHGTQKRASGDPYYFHPLEVSLILADLKMDQSSIITALLHDTVEDTHVVLEDLEEKFGKSISSLVDGVTKLAKIEYQSENARQAENFRKLLLAMSQDIRALIVKLADRLHNMRTLHYIKSPEKRLRIARETMEIYAPLAERIGMQQIKNEMQNLSFAEINPEMRDSIISRLEYLKTKGDRLVDTIVGKIKDNLAEYDMDIEVHGREKTPYSIWRKMDRKRISFEQLSDIIAFRVITDNVETCYKALGVLHQKYKVVPDSFKDFISTPKKNNYQSIHTVLIGPDQKFIEIQIKTKEMHQVAEFGVAAHWSYKQNHDYNTDGEQYKWIRELVYILDRASDYEEFLENTKTEMSHDQVFCFSPKGDLIAMPKGATAVDFAYEVHSKIGNHCSGAKVNGRIVPLRTQLHNGDQVEIITSKTQVPSPAWDAFVVTGKARVEIRRFVRAKKREEYIKLGRSMLQKSFKEQDESLSDNIIEENLGNLNRRNVFDVYASIGEGLTTPEEIIASIFPNKDIKKRKKSTFSFWSVRKEKNTCSSAIPIEGLTPGMALYFAECCNPIPGDSIVGVVTTGKGMTVHTGDCESLSNFSDMPERLVDVSWGKNVNEQYYIGRLKVSLAHQTGSLAILANIIAQRGGNITNLKVADRSPEIFEINIDLSVKGTSHLQSIINTLKEEQIVHSIGRFKG